MCKCYAAMPAEQDSAALQRPIEPIKDPFPAQGDERVAGSSYRASIVL